MSKSGPIIQKYMTYVPHAIDSNKTVQDAQDMMSQYDIRHLPVMRNKVIAGVVSDRDIKMALGLVSTSPNLVLVDDICHEHPYQVSPDAKLYDVAAEMASKRYGSALVVQNGNLVGIFTTVDACKALCALLESRSH